MALFEWKNDLSVGIAEIDRQHKVLIDLINQLHDAMMSRKTKETMSGILKGLLDYTVEHFGIEEKYFDKYGYPDVVAHKKLHKEFIDKIKGFKADLDSGKLTLSMEVLAFLKEWLVKHIKGVDPQYSEFFKAKGVTFTEKI